jgi:hypothetical protein
MFTMQIASARFSAYYLVLLAGGISSLLLPGVSGAEEYVGRPWGRLNTPSLIAPETNRRSGYLGRYNPWSNSGEKSSGEPSAAPRYRQRDNENPSSQAGGLISPYSGGTPAYPAKQYYTPVQPSYPATQHYPPVQPSYPGNGTMGIDGYSASPLPSAPYAGQTPWGGGGNPNYGNYLNEPYDSLQPNRGILWSDMWRQ